MMFARGRRGPETLHRRLFDRGDLKYVVLELLKEKPRHGYEVIRALEERAGGFYAPSPGAVYPTLEMLADMDYVTVTQQDSKKVYAITENGRRFLEAHEPLVEEIQRRISGWWNPSFRHELHEMRRELRDLGRLFDHRTRDQWRDPDKLARIREVVARARTEIEAILTEERRSL